MKMEQEAEVAKEYYCIYDVLEEQLNRTSKEYIYIKRHFVLRWLVCLQSLRQQYVVERL